VKNSIEFSFSESLKILLSMAVILSIFIVGVGASPHVPIILVCLLVMIYAKLKGASWDEIHQGIIEGVSQGIVPILIFMLIGILVASWIYSSTIPTIMYYGFSLVSPSSILLTIFIVCFVIGAVVGSSFTTISTIGVAFMGIGGLLGISLPVIAGAVVSGAFLGNNISPLSDTTNLVSGIGKVDLFKHIKGMAITAIPAFIITCIGYYWLGHNYQVTTDTANIEFFSETIANNFFVSPISLIPVVYLLICAWKKVPALITLITASILGIIIHLIFVGNDGILSISTLFMNGYISNTGVETIDKLLSRGGLLSMLGAASLIILALALGGLLIKLGIIEALLNKVRDIVSSNYKLVLVTAFSAMGINFFVGEQYLSIILPGEAFRKLYIDLNIDDRVLTRTLADSGTAVNALIPWGVSGTFISSTLDVSSASYIMYCFYPLVAPIVTLITAKFILKKTKILCS
jgi:Na+/H+ antiporter nhaC